MNKLGEIYVEHGLGTETVRVDVIGETPKNWRVRLRRKTKLPRKGWKPEGHTFLVPKGCVGFVGAQRQRVGEDTKDQ